VEPELAEASVYFDGSCPLCRAEIEYYHRQDRGGALCFIDVSQIDAIMPKGISRKQAMERIHVRANDGNVHSGAAAFVAVWTRLPNWRWAARAASLPGALAALELGYSAFLPARPFISRLFGRFLRVKSLIKWIKGG
jgi:predicted DCC family thiol-disulfide oxidoreductase YuxK